MSNNDKKSNTVFIDGMRIRKPSFGAPTYVKANGIFDVDQLIKFLINNKPKSGQIHFSVRSSKSGGLYCTMDTYFLEKQRQQEAIEKRVDPPVQKPKYTEEDNW